MSLTTAKPRVRRVNILIAIMIVVIIGTIGVVFALLQLSVPTVTVSSPNGAARMSSACGGALIVDGTPPFPSSGTMRFTCDSTHGAFTVQATGWDTPYFKLPGNYTSLEAVQKAATCPNLSQIPLTNGTQVQFTKGGEYDLCADYSSTTGGSLPGFAFTWLS